MADEIITELWRTKDRIAQEHGYDVDRIIAYVRARVRPPGQRVVDRSTDRSAVDRGSCGTVARQADGPGV